MADDKKLERIVFSNDEDGKPDGSDESDRLPDPYLSPPGVTPGGTATYIKIVVATIAIATAATVAKYYIVDQPEKPQPARYLPSDR